MTDYPYSLVRFSAIGDEAQVEISLSLSPLQDVKIFVASQEREIVDICTLACERFVGFEKCGRYKKGEIFKCFLNVTVRERKPELAASRILSRLSEKVSWAGSGFQI